MIMEELTIAVKTMNEILAPMARGSGVKELGIFIPLSCNFSVATLMPKGESLIVDVLNALRSETAQGSFIWV